MTTRADELTRRQTRNEYVEMLFQQHYVSLRRMAYLLVLDRAAAEDLAMKTFVRALPHWKRVRGLDWPAGYLRKTLVNLARSRARRAQTEAAARRLVVMPDRQEESRREGAEFAELISTLPFNQRVCVTLRYLEDFSEPEIAEILGRPLGTVKSQLSRARERLAIDIDEGKDDADEQ